MPARALPLPANGSASKRLNRTSGAAPSSLSIWRAITAKSTCSVPSMAAATWRIACAVALPSSAIFDAAPFEEEIRKNQALLAQAEADVAKAHEDLKLQAIQNQEELRAARLRVEKSDLEMKDVEQGKGRVKEDEATSAVANAERELQKAETALAALAQVESGGDPVARTFWRWRPTSP